MTPAGQVGLVIRSMRRQDVRAIARIEADRHAADAWSSSAFHEALDRPERYVCLVAAGDGDVVAYGVVSLAGDTADLDDLTVRADHERQGIGRSLLTALLDAATRRGAREGILEVRHDNDPAIALYAAEGFVEISRRCGYYASGHDAIVMRRSLAASGAPPAAAIEDVTGDATHG